MTTTTTTKTATLANLTAHQTSALRAMNRTPLTRVDGRTREIGLPTVNALEALGLVRSERHFRSGRNYRSGKAWARTDVTVILTEAGLQLLAANGEVNRRGFAKEIASERRSEAVWKAAGSFGVAASFTDRAEALEALLAKLTP